MSYRGSGYRGPGDRSRSPPRFADRRPSNASIFDGRHSGPPPRNASDAPRGPRSQFDGPPTRGPPPGGLGSGGAPRTLRDAPPLGTTDRSRSFIRERDYPDRRERSPPLRERSPPPRKFNEPRDFPPRDLDVRSARRASRDGPPSAGSNYSDNPPLSSFRGGFRGRGRGDFFDRGSTRGGRRPLDDRGSDLFRRERSPPPRYGRDLSRDSRDADRRDERRFERREDDRRPEWLDRERERERELDRPARRDPPPGRLESRMSTESVPTNAAHQSSQPPPINPERLAILERSGADTSIRRPSSASNAASTRDVQSETPAYLNGRAETTANRYGSRGSSPPTQAPPVPAFSFSVAPSSAAHQAGAPHKPSESRSASLTEERPTADEPKPAAEDRSAPPLNAPTAPKAAPSAPKAHHASPPPTAPKAPRALDIDATIPSSNRLQGVRSLENLAGPSNQPPAQSTTVPPSPLATRQSLPHLTSPHPPATAGRFAELSAPTGPKATRTSPAQVHVSPRPVFASPRSDTGGFQHASGIQRGQTPPPSAPSGPRNRSFSVSPKAQPSAIPTAPKAARGPVPPRVGDRIMPPQNRPHERPSAMPPFAPPSGPRHPWNQWRRPGAPGGGDKASPTVPAKRDSNGDEKDKQATGIVSSSAEGNFGPLDTKAKFEDQGEHAPDSLKDNHEDRMDIDGPIRRKSNHNESQGHSARQSFFGKTIEKSEDDMEIASSSEDDLSEDEDETLLEAKHAREERQLEEQMVDLGERQYRATSPLESIARLARLSTRDIERVAAQHDEDMDVDDITSDAVQPVPPAVHSSESDDGPEIPTPRGDDTGRGRAGGQGIVPRIRRPTPDAISLPYLFKGEEVPPLHEDETLQDNLKSLEETGADVLAVMEEDYEVEAEVVAGAEDAFASFYQAWRVECESLNKEKEDAEKDRQQSVEPGLEFDAPLAAAINPILEGRRLHKYSSEYALEQVLKQSEETARIEQEKQDREAKKVQADMEKEARIPDQQWDYLVRHALLDVNRLRDPDTLTLVFSYLPPADNFTEKEQDIFIAAFKETPKKWGEIASLLPGRTYKDCIHHYYAFKWDNRFRDNRGKKFKGGRRGRGGKGSRPSRGSALMADLRGGEDIVAPSDSATGRPKRAAAPTTFGEREVESKTSLANPSPAKKLGPGAKDGNGEPGEKPSKKQRRTGESKPGRKGKTQLAALAAAPTASTNKQFLPSVQTKEEMSRLEEANLLANLQAGQHTIPHSEAQMVFNQEGFAHMGDGSDRPKAAAPAAKPSASSYWSVPEQTDFFRYIEHFGTDYAAIASHMGTKTQTMIKNHYQRQIDGGRADLEDAAMRADARRERGEDIGPPPTPTPIVKRKYDNPQSNAPRAIAPQAEPVETEDAMRPSHAAPPKHASPQQAAFQAKQQYTTTAQSTPIPAQRVVPSPLPATSTPASSASHPRGGLQHPLGSRLGFLASESRPGAQPPSPFRLGQEQATSTAALRSQPPPPQPSRTSSNVSSELLVNLRQEQEKAMRMQQAEYDSEPRLDHLQHQPQPHMHHTHGSPANQPIAAPPQDRKPPVEERAPTPPRGAHPISSSRPPLFGPNAGPMHQFSTSLPPFAARASFNLSPTKADASRPGSVPTSAPLPPPVQPHAPSAAPAPMPTPAPEPPKRSNVMSLLNSEPEEPKPPKRDSQPTPSRIASPGPASFPPSSGPQGISGVPSSRRENFGQPSMPHSHFHRPSYSQTSTPAPPPATLKHEPSSGGMPPMQQASKQDWPPRMMGPGSHPSPPNAAPLERDGRPPFYQPHRSSMLGLGTPRAGPSPPPSALHSRTPSLSAQQQSGPPPRDQRSILGGPPPGTPLQSSQNLHSSSSYGMQQQYPPYSQAPAQMNRAHHSHNSSINEPVSILQRMHGGGSREEAMRYEDEVRANEEQRIRQRYDAIEKQRERDHLSTQRAQEVEMERQRQQQQEQTYGRGPLPPHPMHSSSFAPSPFPQRGMGINLREQAAREAESAVVHEQRRMQEEQDRRRHEHQQMPPQGFRDAQPDYRRRPDDPLFHQRRTTPYGGPPYAPPPQRR